MLEGAEGGISGSEFPHSPLFEKTEVKIIGKGGRALSEFFVSQKRSGTKASP